LAKAHTIAMRPIRSHRSSREKNERLIRVIHYLPEVRAIDTFNVKLAQRVLVPLARLRVLLGLQPLTTTAYPLRVLRDNQRLSCGLWQLSRMASFIQRAGGDNQPLSNRF